MKAFRFLAICTICVVLATSSIAWADSQEIAYLTAINYLVVFYPRWFTYQLKGSGNSSAGWAGPDRMGPIFHVVVAPNDDTLYVGSFMDLEEQPVIVTIPDTDVTYSLLTMDTFGNVFNTDVEAPNIGRIPPGTYGLTGPGWVGTLPSGVKPVPVPFNLSIWIIRADKYSPQNKNQILQADMFRRSLHAATLKEYMKDRSAGAAKILPVIFYSMPYKVIADDLIATDPIRFLTQLQASVKAYGTPPLSPSEQQLSDEFDRLFADPQYKPQFIAGAQAAHALILDRYQSNIGATNWITFTDIGAWGTNYLDRSATTEYLDLSNTHDTAAYYHTFKDANGDPLDTNVASGYVLTFPKGQPPKARRFWSLTMYTPDSITLVPNDKNKYVVASYTPGLTMNPDGSTSIYMFPQLPQDVPAANWLPAPKGRFDVVLRFYGPEGSVANNTYVPPGIVAVP